MPGSSKFVTARFCATCKPQLYWPYHHNYLHCPACGMATILKSTEIEKVMSVAEAKRKVAHIEFDKWVDKESERDRIAREMRAVRMEKAAEKQRERDYDRFRQVIDEGGFTEVEKDFYKAQERALPPRSNPRYADPLAE